MSTSSHSSPRLLGELKLCTEVGPFLGDTRIRLLEAIDRLGSLSQAAKSLPLSYRAAWDALDDMNNLAESPLVIRTTGGKQGGGTQLTPYGRQIVALFRAMEAEYQQTLAKLQQALPKPDPAGGTSDVRDLRRLIRRLSLKSSARNQFIGTVVAMRTGPVDFEVSLELDDHQQIHSVITRESAESMGLQLGCEVYALIKSHSVLLVTEPGLRLSPRNQLWGEITRIHNGPVNSEVVLALPGGKHLCAVITRESVDQLGLTEGMAACGAFKASAVLLCSQD
ncbi:TOBE domain-containing protein [Pseudaeromonas sp. ZJS20]|uniref:TOBE domain-containing protein n=1 Tax=Pseudaeromonas aegiceratis TaxID=3153928 RepID=UPI00390CA798